MKLLKLIRELIDLPEDCMGRDVFLSIQDVNQPTRSVCAVTMELDTGPAVMLSFSPLPKIQGPAACLYCHGDGVIPGRDQSAVGSAVKLHPCPQCLGTGRRIGVNMSLPPEGGGQ